jgi:hypothetical protein
MAEYEVGLNCGLLDYETFPARGGRLWFKLHAALRSADASSFEYMGFDVDPRVTVQ